MSEHTPTPWYIQEHPAIEDEFYLAGQRTEDHPYFNVTSLGPDILSDEDYPRKRADAERIVACVNAFEGIKDPEAWIKETLDGIKSLRDQS